MNRTAFHKITHWRPLPYLVAFLFTLMIFGIHMLPNMDSMLNENNTRVSHGFLRSQIDYHQEIAPFARRPLTSLLIETIVREFGLRAGHAFILVNFLLLCLSGILLFWLSKTLLASLPQALINMVVYFLSFSVLFAFFPPVFSYDEPLQYCFIFLSLISFVRKNGLAFVVFFTLALISRETSILLLPALFLFARKLEVPVMNHCNATSDPKAFSSNKDVFEAEPKKFFNLQIPKIHLNRYVFLLLPLLLYGIFLIVHIDAHDHLKATQIEMGSRYSCFLENFESLKNSVESWTSVYLALMPYLYLVGVRRFRKLGPQFQTKWISAFLLTVLINTPIVILTAFARETRLFALPLFFLWPLFGQIFGQSIRRVFLEGSYLDLWRKWWLLILFVIATIVNYGFCFHIYPGLGLGENTFFGEYLFLINSLMLVHFLLLKTASNV